MSGGSMDYYYSNIEEYAEQLHDPILKELSMDLAKVWHDAEWYNSSDIGEGAYNKTVAEFKTKWIGDNHEALAEIIYRECADNLTRLKQAFMCHDMCLNCKHFRAYDNPDSDYGRCDFHEFYDDHGWQWACERFENEDRSD